MSLNFPEEKENVHGNWKVVVPCESVMCVEDGREGKRRRVNNQRHIPQVPL